MKTRSLVGVCIGLLFATGMASTSFANVQSFSANVFGTPMGPMDCEAPPALCEFLLSGPNGEEITYTGFKIKGAAAGPAKIVAIEGDFDKVLIENAVITATAAGSGSCTNTSSGIEYCPSISYSAWFASPPSTAGGNVTFVRSISGTFKRGAQPATLSAVKVRGAVAQVLIGTDGFKKMSAISPNLYSAAGPTEIYDRTQVWYQGGTPALPDPREVSGQMWVFAKYGTEVLTATAKTVKNPAGGGPPHWDCAANKKQSRTLRQCNTE